MRRTMDFAQVKQISEEAASKLGADVDELFMYAWPELFASTSGPRGGLGGAAMTWFQVLAFKAENGQGLMWCGGMWKDWNSEVQSWN